MPNDLADCAVRARREDVDTDARALFFAILTVIVDVFVLGAYAPALRSRSLAIMTAVAVVLLIGEVLSIQAGWLAVQPTAEPPWWVTVARAAIGIPIIAGLMAATPLRLRVTRAGLQVLAAALYSAPSASSPSHTHSCNAGTMNSTTQFARRPGNWRSATVSSPR